MGVLVAKVMVAPLATEHLCCCFSLFCGPAIADLVMSAAAMVTVAGAGTGGSVPHLVQTIETRDFRPVVDPASINNNCGPAAFMASATGDGGSDDDHMLLRVVGAFCAVVFPDRLETYEGATHVKDEAQMEGRLAITGMGFLDAEYVMTSLAISLDFRAHFAQEERNANFKRLSPEQREACVRALAEAQREGKRPTIVLGTKGPLPGVEAVGDVYLIERSNVHYCTSEREGAPPMTRGALISRATAALKATLLAAAEGVGAESEEVRSHLAAMVDECPADAAFDGVRGAAGDELRALQTRIAALGARAAAKAASGTLDSFVGGSKRPRDDPFQAPHFGCCRGSLTRRAQDIPRLLVRRAASTDRQHDAQELVTGDGDEGGAGSQRQVQVHALAHAPGLRVHQAHMVHDLQEVPLR